MNGFLLKLAIGLGFLPNKLLILVPLPPANITKSRDFILTFLGYFFYHFKILLNSLLFKYYETNFFCFSTGSQGTKIISPGFEINGNSSNKAFLNPLRSSQFGT